LQGAAALTAFYGLDFADPSLEVLMRHRAILFGLLGLLLLGAAFRPAWRPLALAGGFASVLSFLALAHGASGANAAVMRVAAMDWVALAFLVVAAVVHARTVKAARTPRV
jgi:hypothetical protein